MSTLGRYLSLRFLGAFLGALLILALVVTVVDMLLNLDELIEARDDVAGAVIYLVKRAGAQFLPYLVPVATFVGVFVTLGGMARSNELVAAKAGGISPVRACLPVLALCGGIALANLWLHERLAVPFAADVAIREGAPRAEFSMTGAIWVHAGRFIFNTPRLASDDEQILDVRVFERDEQGRLVRFLHAQTASLITPRRFSLEQATIRHFEPERPQAAPRVEHRERMVLDLADQQLPLLAEQLPGLGIGTIAAHVRAGLDAGRNPTRARLAFHTRLSQPLLVMVLALLAIPLGLAVELTRSLARPSLLGVALAAALLTGREYASHFVAATGDAQVALWAPWAVVALFGLLSLWLLQRAPR